MKNLYLYVLLTTGLLISCQKKEHFNDGLNNQFNDLEIDLDGMFGEGLVFGYVNNDESLTEGFEILKKEFNEIKSQNNEVEFITIYLSNSENKILLDGYHIVSKDNTTIEFDHKNQNDNSRSEPVPVNYIAAACPDGYESPGSCSNPGDTEGCITEKVGDYFRANLNGIGDCANVQVNVGVTGTKVCGTRC